MKILAMLGCLVVLACGCAGREPFVVPADDDWTAKPAAVPFSKIGRGLANIGTSPADLWATPIWLRDEGESLGYALGVGIPEGLCNTVVRLGAGVVEVLSFPLYRHRTPLYNHPYGVWVFAGKDDSVSTKEP